MTLRRELSVKTPPDSQYLFASDLLQPLREQIGRAHV